MWLLPNLKVPRTDLKSAFSISLRMPSLLVRSPLTALTALSISADGVIGLRAVERRRGIVLRLVVGDELLVGLVRQVVDPILRAGHADREILQPRQRQIVDGERSVERDLALEARLRVLRDELHAGAAGIEGEDRVGLGGAGFRQLGGKIELVGPARKFLAEDLALEGRLHADQHVPARRIVWSDQESGLHAFLVHVAADRGRRLVVIPRGREHIGRAVFAGERRGAGIGDHVMVLESTRGLSEASSTFDQI